MAVINAMTKECWNFFFSFNFQIFSQIYFETLGFVISRTIFDIHLYRAEVFCESIEAQMFSSFLANYWIPRSSFWML